MTDPDLIPLTVKDYALLMGVHPQTVYTAIREDRLVHAIERPFGSSAIRILVPAALVKKRRAA